MGRSKTKLSMNWARNAKHTTYRNHSKKQCGLRLRFFNPYNLGLIVIRVSVPGYVGKTVNMQLNSNI
jgi:hypothetical protein